MIFLKKLHNVWFSLFVNVRQYAPSQAACVFFVTVLFSAAFPLAAQEPATEAILVYRHAGIENALPELIPSIEYTVYAVDAAFYDAGVEIRVPYIESGGAVSGASLPGRDDFDFDRLQALCEEAGVGTAVTVYTTYGEGRLVWRFAAYTMPDRVARATESFWTPLVAGVLTDVPVDGSVAAFIRN